MKLSDAIKKRKSVRKFKSGKPDWRHIVEAIDSMRYAPRAGNNFALKTIMISDDGKIDKLAEASQQEFIKQAKYVVVVCGNVSVMENLYEDRGGRYLKQQAGAAIENFLLSLEEKGLSTCWIGHFVDDQIKHILGIPDKMEVEALFPIGYEKKVIGVKGKKKPETSSYLYFDKYGNKKMNKDKINPQSA